MIAPASGATAAPHANSQHLALIAGCRDCCLLIPACSLFARVPQAPAPQGPTPSAEPLIRAAVDQSSAPETRGHRTLQVDVL